MTYLRKEADKLIILPPQDADTTEYLREVHRELDSEIAKGTPEARHWIELENGHRGGSFTNSALAVNELLTELVDASRSTASKKRLPAN